MRKIFAVFLAISLVFVFVGCDKPMNVNSAETETEQNSDRAVNSGDVDLDVTAESVTEETETREIETKNEVENKEVTTTKKVMSDNPSDWTKVEVIEYYKKAAKKSHSVVQSSQRMVLHKLEVKNSGILGEFFNIIEPVVNTVIGNNEITFKGVTGGYNKLNASDIKTVKAYKEGKYTVVEMTMLEQTDGIYGNSHEGTVGHAISVVGNVSVVAEQFPAFDINFDRSDIKIHYTKPTVKVKINEKGIIEKGTWSHYSKINIRNLMINKIAIGQAYAEIEYIIQTGGGF